jgi:hypothetical protein
MSNGPQSRPAADEWERRIERDTERLRAGTDPALRRIRDLIAGHGVDIGTSLVANLMPEDANMLSGFIVTASGRVHEFEYDWRGTQPDQGRLAAWRDITDSYESRAFREPISVALTLAGRTAHAPTA